MDPLQTALALKRAGRFSDALRALGDSKTIADRTAADVLRADLLERVGEHAQARALAASLLKSSRVDRSGQSTCERVIGMVLVHDGDVNGGLARLQRAAARAKEVPDLENMVAAQLQILVLVSDRSGPAAAAALLSEVRDVSTRIGDPHVTSLLHLYVAEMEARRGLFSNAARHTGVARRILSTAPNCYLEAFAEHIDLALSILDGRFEEGLRIGARAAALAEQSGSATMYHASVGNTGNLFYAIGEFDKAIAFLERAMTGVAFRLGANTNAALEALARIFLAQDRFEECGQMLDRIDAAIRTDEDRILHAHRNAALTRTELLARQGHCESALLASESALSLTERAADAFLSFRVQLARADILRQLGRDAESVDILRRVQPQLRGESPELYGQSERILACLACSPGSASESDGTSHYRRSLRIYEDLGTELGRLELNRSWHEANARHGRKQADPSSTPQTGHVATATVEQALHGIAMALAFAGRPTLVARELVNILAATHCVYAARVVSRVESDAELTIESIGDRLSAPERISEQTFAVGLEKGRRIEIVVLAKDGAESTATIGALLSILRSRQELEEARVEREEHARLWPIEDIPIEGQRFIISGHMQDLMKSVRRIAKTSINVLITGESGTGKEILARAIHDFSDRAHKPFVPFNCAAIPRDLLESQLFGHRRGAFTGAERDQLGVIRAARNGTLFLDEVGELGVDLQPKLLRFLESGEVSPLGEPNPFNIDVRIVAATNSNLEEAVRTGKFREDLFYRLNVVPLAIRPLRERRDEIPGFVNHFVMRAAEEFTKGHLRVAEETMERLLLYRWPGNVRQLQNEIRRMVALAEPNSTLLPRAISEDILGALPNLRLVPLNGHEIAVPLHDKLLPTLARIEGEMIKAALAHHKGKVDAVAKALGISRKGLYLKRQRLGL